MTEYEALIVSKYEELLALHKALIEAKFHPNPENLLVSGSPFIADISNRVVDLLINMDEQKDPSKRNAWLKILDIKNQRTYWERAIGYACEFNGWKKFSVDEKKRYVSCLLSPLKFCEYDVQQFIHEVDSINT